MHIEFGVGYIDGTVSGPFNTEDEMKFRLTQVEKGYPLGRTVINDKPGPWKDNDPEHGLCYANPRYKPGYVYVPPPTSEELLGMFPA